MADSIAADIPVAADPSRTRRSVRLLANVVVAALVAVFLAAGYAVVSGSWQARTVLTGSMSPHYPTGSVVLTQRQPLSDLKVGQVVVFHRPDDPAMLVVHRVIALQRTHQGIAIRTKGDANPVADPWDPFMLRGPDVYVAHHDLPYVGYVVTYMRAYRLQLVAFLGAAFLALAAVRYLRRPEE